MEVHPRGVFGLVLGQGRPLVQKLDRNRDRHRNAAKQKNSKAANPNYGTAPPVGFLLCCFPRHHAPASILSIAWATPCSRLVAVTRSAACRAASAALPM